MAGKLSGKVCLIAGGTGSVGEGIVRVFLREGARVVVPSRSAERLARLAEYAAEEASVRDGGGLLTLVGELGTPAGAEALRDEIAQKAGPLDAVIASLGGSYEGRQTLLSAPPEVWREFQDNNLNAHYACARAFLPTLVERSGASYTLLGGLSAVLPIGKYGPVCVNSAAQLMLARVLFEELKDTRVRINQVMFGMVATRARRAFAKPQWLTAEEIGEFLAYLVSPGGRMIANSVLHLGDRPAPG